MRLLLVGLLLTSPAFADKIHILDRTIPGIYQAVIHTATPGGSNSAGITWVNVLKALVEKEIQDCTNNGTVCTGSVLKVGTDAGEIAQAELDDIVAGVVREIEWSLLVGSCGETVACVNGLVDDVVTITQSQMAERFKWFGRKVN